MKYINTTFSLLHTIVVGSGLSTLGSTAVLAQSAESRSLAVSNVPAVLDVPADNRPYLRAAAGTQNYLCMPPGWTFIGPQATLFIPSADRSPIRMQVATHFLSPNPDTGGVPRATWQSSFDTSAVWAVTIGSSADAAGPGAIPWLLLLQVEGAEQGPMGGSALSGTTFIQRINTSGGTSPTTACVTGARAFAPYTAEYVFYRKASH